MAAKALIIGASGGIGSALARRLNARGAAVTGLSRRGDGLDLLDKRSIERLADGLAQKGERYDLIVNAAGVLETQGAPPEKSFREIDPEAMARIFAVNAIGASLVFKHFGPLLRDGRRAVFAALSARVGSIGDNRLGGWMSYRASKAALNQITRCAAIEFSRSHPEALIVALHPGTIETGMTRNYARGRYTASPESAADQLLEVIAALKPAQSGGFYDYAGREIPW